MNAAQDNVLPFSCSTNLSKDVHEHLRRSKLTGAAWDVCSLLHDFSFGNAGWHRKQGQSELESVFDLADWSRRLDMNRSHLQRVMAHIVACHIFTMEPMAEQPGRALLTWNINFDEWLIYDQRRTPIQAKRLNTVTEEGAPQRLSTLAPQRLSQPVPTASKHASLAAAIQALPEEALIKDYVNKEDVEEGVANATQQKLWSSPRIPIAPLKKKLEQVARYKKTTATKEQIAAMWDAWEKQSGTAQRKNMSDKELKRFYAVMARLIDKGVTPEELASLAAALIRSSAWKSNYTARPSEVEDNLSTLRPIARGEVQPSTPTNRTQKGKTYERHDGTWTGNHGKDEAIVIKC